MRGELFTFPAYIEPLLQSASASRDTGWERIDAPQLAAPLWRKSHSWGEFVFDQSLARAYAEHGLNYYPKLVCAPPFTPVTGPRLGANVTDAAEDLQARVHDDSLSSAHILFLPESESALLDSSEWLQRQSIRLVWHNKSYTDFDDFLSTLNSKRRKSIRAERRQVAKFDFHISWRSAANIDEDQWPRLYALYASTYHMRGQEPYLRPDCLRQWGRCFGENMLFCLAEDPGRSNIQAMAFFFTDGAHLYGRHWGAAADWSGLHFELCYYRAIEFCIERGIPLFDAGVQGGHRVLRGFEPELNESRHYFANASFARAISAHFQAERAAIQQQFAELKQQTAFRQDN